MTTQTQTHRALPFLAGEISRQEQRLAGLERQRDAALAQRGQSIAAASAAQDAIAAEERRRAGISDAEPPSPYQRGGVFLESSAGIVEALAARRGGPWLAAAVASDEGFKQTQQLNGLSRLIGQVRLELEQLRREEAASLLAAGQNPRDWSSPTERLMSKPAASTGGIG